MGGRRPAFRRLISTLLHGHSLRMDSATHRDPQAAPESTNPSLHPHLILRSRFSFYLERVQRVDGRLRQRPGQGARDDVHQGSLLGGSWRGRGGLALLFCGRERGEREKAVPQHSRSIGARAGERESER